MDEIINLFIKEPEREFHVREIARLVGKSPTTVSKWLRKLEKEALLKSENKLNHLIYKANSANEEFRRAKTNYNLDILHKSGFINFIKEEFNHPESIVLFGSFANGENSKNSDIDILVVSSVRKDVDLKKFEKKLGYKIQMFVFSKQDIEKMQKNNKELLNSIINGIVLHGYLEVFR